MNRKILKILLVIAMMLSLFTACKDNDDNIHVVLDSVDIEHLTGTNDDISVTGIEIDNDLNIFIKNIGLF